MKIVVNHLTRMRGDHICVAGLDLDTRRPVRPLAAGPLTQKMLKRHGGMFDIAEIVDLGQVRHVGEAPEVEDHRFDLASACAVGPMPVAEFWELLNEVARSTLTEIFGEDLERRGHTYATEAGRGVASLGCLAIPSQLVPRLAYPYGKLRLSLPNEQADVAVTDLRCYEPDGRSLRKKVIGDLNAGMRAGRAVIVAVGLGRPFRVPEDTADRHWVQINNVYPAGVSLFEADSG